MNILVLLGPPAAGKSTLARNTLKAGTLGTTAYILNDDATSEDGVARQMFDVTAEMSELTELRTMGEGCFGCSDDATLLRELKQLSEARTYDTVLLEPFGFISGDELPDLLIQNGYRPFVISLLDVQHIRQNEAWGIVPSQLRRATVGIGLTKVSSEGLDDDIVEAYLAEHAPGKATFRLGVEDPLPAWVTERLGSVTAPAHVPRHDEGCAHGCKHHDHGHAHHHDHHAHPDLKYSFLLRDGVTKEDIERIFSGLSLQAALRVKGILNGTRFQGQIFSRESSPMVSQTLNWVSEGSSDFRNMVTFYASRPIQTDFLSGLVLDERHRIARSTKELLRSSAHCSTEESIALLRAWMSKCPSRVNYGSKGPIVYTEATEIVNELRKRPDIIASVPQLVDEAMCLRVDHAITVVQENPPGSRWYDDPGATEWKRDCAITIAWFALHRPDAMGTDRLETISMLNLDDLLASGLSGMERFNSDPQKAAIFAEEAGDVARLLGAVSQQLTDQYRRLYLLACAWDREHDSNTAHLWLEVCS